MRTSKLVFFTRFGLAALTGLGLCTWAVQAQNSQSAPAAHTQAPGGKAQNYTADWIQKVARNNDMEIALAEVGARKAHNTQLKQYCLQVQHEQIRNNDRLKSVARQHGVSVEQSLPKSDLKELARLEKESGAKLDRSLAKRLVQEEQKNLTNLEKATSQANDVQHYAQQTLPKLRQHLEQGQTVAGELGVKSSAISGLRRHLPAAVGGTQ